MAENLDVNVNVNTSQAQQNITNLNNRLGNLNNSFATLRSALAGVAFGTLITDAMRFADGIQDISDATGIATANILGFSSAVQASGGDFEKAQSGLLKFVETIGEARSGNETAAKSFEKIGISLGEVKNLSEQDLLQKTIRNLANMRDGSQRAAAQVDLLSKALRGVDAASLQRNFEISVSASKQYESSIKAAADANQALEQVNAKLRAELLKFLEPVNKLIAKIDANSESFMRLYNAIKMIVIVLGSLFIFVRVAAVLVRLYTAIKAVVAAMRTMSGFGNGIVDFYKLWFKWSDRLKNALKTTREALRGTTDALAKTDLRNQIGKIKDLSAAVKKLKEVSITAGKALLFIATAGIAGSIGYNQEVETPKPKGPRRGRRVKERSTEEVAAELERSRLTAEEYEKNSRKQDAAIRSQGNSLADLAKEIKNVTSIFATNNKQVLKNILTETAYLNMTNDEIELAQIQQQIHDDALRSIAQLEEQKKNLTAAEASLIPIIDQQIKKIIEQKAIDQTRATQMTTNMQRIRKAQEDFRKSLEDINRAFNQQEALTQLQEELDLIGLVGDELDKQSGLININRDLRKQMMDLSLQLMQLDEDRARLGEEQYQKERQRIIQQMLDVQMLSDAKKAALLEEIALRKQAEDSYLEGTKRAMTNIAESFKPVNMAQETIRQGWDKMSGALDEFVETGKLNFADLARSIIQDITKMILKMLVFKAIEAGLNAIFPGLGTAVSAVGGRANGGPVNKNMPYMVGERGPELFIPQNNGKIVPNNDLKNADSTRQQPSNTIYNNYYINALDAKSVAQLFAENRKAIFGANKMAEREMSYAGVR